MQKLFSEVATLDKRCYDEFGLSEDILMEHAADGMADFIASRFVKNSKVIIVCGSGNNGADGIALSRLLHKNYDVKLFFIKEPNSNMAILQHKRAQSIGVEEILRIQECDIVVDAIVGTGFKGELSTQIQEQILKMNSLNAYKIACDVPSGLKADGTCDKNSFQADRTLTMGALKKSMFLDEAKEYVGEIEVLELGVSRKIYERDSSWVLLDLEDIELPHRELKNSHKGSFGHLAVLSGEKIGASLLSASSALKFGSGLVTVVGFKKENIPYSIMSSQTLPKNCSAIALGMGLGKEFSDDELKKIVDNRLPIVADADIFYMPIILELLKREEIVITPHPKEFVELLKRVNIENATVEVVQKNRFKYVELFCRHYPNVTLLLKGANVIIGKEDKFFINPHGTSTLAKGGSGDVLSGLIGSLLAQGHDALSASINASLVHTKLAQNYTGADFSLRAEDLIDGIGNL